MKLMKVFLMNKNPDSMVFDRIETNKTKQNETEENNETKKTTFVEPEWHSTIKELKVTVSCSQLIVATDMNVSGAKMFALFNSHQHVVDYIYRILKEQRMLYKLKLTNMSMN